MKELGYKALDSRFKRISDRMIHDIRKLYKEINIDIEPSWYLIFGLLRDNNKISITEIAQKINYSHPSVVIMIKKMVIKGYINTRKDDIDKRKQVIELTDKSKNILPELKTLWEGCDRAILQLIDKELAIIGYLDKIDLELNNSSFYDRFKYEYLKNKKHE